MLRYAQILTRKSATPPKLGKKQLDSEPESADKAKKYADQRNNSTPQLFIADSKENKPRSPEANAEQSSVSTRRFYFLLPLFAVDCK